MGSQLGQPASQAQDYTAAIAALGRLGDWNQAGYGADAAFLAPLRIGAPNWCFMVMGSIYAF